MAQALIKLFPLGMVGRENQMFGCEIGSNHYKVVPSNHLADKDKPGIPVRVNGIRHVIRSVYNISHHMHDLYLYADAGPYKGYQGPRIAHQQVCVTLKDFAAHFLIVLWKRENGSLWSCRVATMKEVEEHLTDGWFLDAPPEKIEDKEYIHVSRNGNSRVELNPFYTKPVEAAAT